MFPKEYVNYGRITVSGDRSVSVYSDWCHAKNLNNVPCGKVKSANWQGDNIHLEMENGQHYIYEDFSGYSSQWR